MHFGNGRAIIRMIYFQSIIQRVQKKEKITYNRSFQIPDKRFLGRRSQLHIGKHNLADFGTEMAHTNMVRASCTLHCVLATVVYLTFCRTEEHYYTRITANHDYYQQSTNYILFSKHFVVLLRTAKNRLCHKYYQESSLESV